MRDGQAAQVGDALAEHEFAVFVQVVCNHERIKLLFDAGGALFEILQVLGRPPVVQIALRVILRSLIVEAVRHLMTNHGADSAIIQRVVSLGIEEGRLKNAGREHDFIHVGVEISVYCRWTHPPLIAVHGFINLGKFAMELKHAAPL